MNEIEKLYENAGIEREFEKPVECTKNPYISCEGCMLYDDKKGKCNNKIKYPPFTAKKQLELIKWLCEKDNSVRIDFDENEWGVATENYGGYFKDNLSDALSSIINTLWQSLTEEERKQIKEILK